LAPAYLGEVEHAGVVRFCVTTDKALVIIIVRDTMAGPIKVEQVRLGRVKCIFEAWFEQGLSNGVSHCFTNSHTFQPVAATRRGRGEEQNITFRYPMTAHPADELFAITYRAPQVPVISE